MAKRGRKAKHYVTSEGETIVGLSRRQSDGRWRVIGTQITFSEPDERLAVARYRQIQASRDATGERVTFLQRIPLEQLDDEQSPFWQSVRGFVLTVDDEDNLFRNVEVPAEAFWAKMRELILNQPNLAAQKIGIPELAYLSDLPVPKASPTLAELGRLYQDKSRVTPHEKKKTELFWQEFMDVVEVKTVKEITADAIARYHDKVIDTGHSHTYIKHRFGKIKTVLHFAQKRGRAAREIETVLAYCKMLNPPRPGGTDPHPIAPDDFHRLLNQARGQWKAILLCALNGCLYAKEIADLDQVEIDWQKGVLVTDRQKTGVTRVAVLWPRTLSALRELPRHQGTHLFASRSGKRYHPDQIRKGFAKLREAANLPARVKFSDIRDGAYTAAVQGKDIQFEHARILGGHRTGMTDHYIKRNASMVTACCQAIEAHYFKQSLLVPGDRQFHK
jgi:integrase